MPKTHYTINCDLGEGISGEEFILPFIDVASVACGGHFGNQESIRNTLALVKKFRKKAGAHPSYPDQENFGRKSLPIEPQKLIESLEDQIKLFLKVSEEEKFPIDHIKFHGALYNDAAENVMIASLLVNFLKLEFGKIPLFVPPHSEIEKAAIKVGLPIRLEIFGDRAYTENYKLVSRSVENSLFNQKNQVISHLESIMNQGNIKLISGEFIPIHAETICFHGDNPGIVEILPFVRDRFWN
ncbi:LamB/YcsF family protein [Algoriphagus sp.]|uniref:LamB/YcsF family protein n=1 Tax=Algoriphagus sp. TaxID=1872435 RepID=UPI00391DBEDB